MQLYQALSEAMNKVETNHKDLVPLFLTLGVKNCKAEVLKYTISKMMESWNRLLEIEQLKQVIKGWFSSLEVTLNKHTREFHPHIHAVLYVPESYFGQGNPKYIRQAEWVQLWKASARLDYSPSADIRRVYKTQSEGFSRLAKYLFKGEVCAQHGTEPWNIPVDKLLDGYKSWRLVAFGGVLEKVLALQGGTNLTKKVKPTTETQREAIGTLSFPIFSGTLPLVLSTH
jgi:hypothetical protein